MKPTFVRTGACLALLIAAAFPSHATQPVACDSLLGSFIEGATITAAQLNAATATLPEHCEVLGTINPRTGIDGQPYAIKLHLRMPTAWNERFFYQGGGGTDGNLGNADAAQIQQGYAVVSTDSGHDNTVNNTALAGSFQFGFDPQARSDYGYNGPARVVTAAKAISKKFYRKPAKYSYFVGCSEGGREGLMFSQRYPDVFDGIVSGNPGMDLPKAAVAEAWDSQASPRRRAPTRRSETRPGEFVHARRALHSGQRDPAGLRRARRRRRWHGAEPERVPLRSADARASRNGRLVRRASHRARKSVGGAKNSRGRSLRGLVLGSWRGGTRLAGLEDRPAVAGTGQHVIEHHARRWRSRPSSSPRHPTRPPAAPRCTAAASSPPPGRTPGSRT
jgi:pimeloyl-ACP methyl ester carboxylesterase